MKPFSGVILLEEVGTEQGTCNSACIALEVTGRPQVSPELPPPSCSIADTICNQLWMGCLRLVDLPFSPA